MMHVIAMLASFLLMDVDLLLIGIDASFYFPALQISVFQNSSLTHSSGQFCTDVGTVLFQLGFFPAIYTSVRLNNETEGFRAPARGNYIDTRSRSAICIGVCVL